MSTRPDPGPPPTAREQKKTLLTLVAMVVALHSIAIAIYYLGHVPERPLKTQQMFVAGWVVATVIVIAPMMRRIRQARRRFRRSS